MRISELSARTDVSVPTLKYYLREGLLPAGRRTSRTQAVYDDSHVERVRLIRALSEIGGLPLARVRTVLEAIGSPAVSRLDLLATAQDALIDAESGHPCGPSTADAVAAEPEPVPGSGVDPGSQPDSAVDAMPALGAMPVLDVPMTCCRAHRWLERRGWPTQPADPLADELDQALRACDVAQLGLDDDRLSAYADAVEQVARVDLRSVPDEPTAAVRQVILGTVLIDAVLTVLRRLAQRRISVELAEQAGGEDTTK
jgi:DNA-binding transcriptional MerR regulator